MLESREEEKWGSDTKTSRQAQDAYLKPWASLLSFALVVALGVVLFHLRHVWCTSSGEGLGLGDERRRREQGSAPFRPLFLF